jgi:hypothetical protein
VRTSKRPTLRFASFAELHAFLSRLAGASIATSGDWAAGQIYYHLAASFEATCEPGVGPGARSGRLSKLPQRLFVLLFGFPRGVPIPAPLRDRLSPPDGLDEAEQLARLQKALDAFDASTHTPPPHPVLGPLTRREWRRLHLRHCEHHLRHLTIREHSPGVG